TSCPARGHRRSGPIPVRERHLRHPGGVPARAQERGRLSHSGHGCQFTGGNRAARRRHRQAGLRIRPPPCTAERVRGMKTLRSVSWRKRVWIVYVAVCAALTAAYMWFPPLKGNGPLINLLGLSSSIAIAVGIYLHRPRARAAWFLFIVGQFLFFAGDLYTYSYPKVFGADVEFPSLGDAIYLTVYPALVGGLLTLVKRRNPRGDRAGMIDSLILTVGIGLISWVFL